MEKAGSEPRKVDRPALGQRGDHVQVPAALRVLLQPDGLHAVRPGADDRGLAARVPPGPRAGRGAARHLRRRAADARRRRDHGRRVEPAGLLRQPHHLRRRADREAHRRLQGGRARPDPALVPGLDAGDERLPVQHQDLRAQVEGRQAHQAVRLPDGAQRRAAPHEHRPHPADPRDGRSDGRRARRARQHPVLRLGAWSTATSCCPAASSSCVPRRSPTSSEPGRQQDEDLLRRARLLREPAEEVHERLGLDVPQHHRRRHWPCPATKRACCPGSPSPTCAITTCAGSGTTRRDSTPTAATAG